MQIKALFLQVLFAERLLTKVHNDCPRVSSPVWVLLSNKNKAFLLIVEKHVDNVRGRFQKVVHGNLLEVQLFLMLLEF